MVCFRFAVAVAAVLALSCFNCVCCAGVLLLPVLFVGVVLLCLSCCCLSVCVRLMLLSISCFVVCALFVGLSLCSVCLCLWFRRRF